MQKSKNIYLFGTGSININVTTTKPNKLHVILQISDIYLAYYNINIFDKMTESHCTFYVMLWYGI